MGRFSFLRVFLNIGFSVFFAAASVFAQEPVVLFGLGMHIEPMGRTAQGFASGSQGDYWNSAFFNRHVADIQAVAAIVERHGGRMTVQAQSPFTQVAIQRGNPVLAQLSGAGHEIALHFHEDAHLGPNSTSLSPNQWCEVMQEDISLVQSHP